MRMNWADGKIRCCWANPKNERYIRYHDEEWGVPVHDDRKLFEMLILECFQAGLSWECVLNKRDAFREAFDGFDVEKVCDYKEENMIRKNIDVSLGEDGARPIAMLVQLASQYVSNIEIHRDTMTVNAKSIMGMMTLGLAKGQKLELLIDGEDEETAMKEMENYLTGN